MDVFSLLYFSACNAMSDSEGEADNKYSNWRLPQIKAELKRRGAQLRGRKWELVKR